MISDQSEPCRHCGRKAYARIHSDLPLLSGWYGSTVADMTQFVVLDASEGPGPVCDEFVQNLIAAGKIIEDRPVETLDSLPRDNMAALIKLGVELVERDVADASGMTLPPVPPFHFEDADHMTGRAVSGLFGRTEGIDLVGVGQVMAMSARARGRPLLGDERERVVGAYLDRITTALDLGAGISAKLSRT